MPVQRIKGIKVGKEKEGEFAGGYIYGANFSFGGVESPSSLKISVVNEGVGWEEASSKKTAIISQYMGLRTGEAHKHFSIASEDVFKIEIGSIKIAMCLIGMSEEKTPDLHTFNYDFVDTSHILDRIFIGLPNRHQKPNAKERPYLIENLSAMCPNCVTGIADRQVNASMLALRDAAHCSYAVKFQIENRSGIEFNFQYNPPNKDQIAELGGIITLGREEFVDHGSSGFKPVVTGTQKVEVGESTVTYPVISAAELPCDVPNVSYKFVDLIAAISKLGIEIKGLPNNWEKTGIKNDYRQSYTGTLREVLGNWCADFGYSYVWGFLPSDSNKLTKTIKFIDLSSGTSNEIKTVKDIVEKYHVATPSKGIGKSPFLVKNINYQASIANTYSSNYLSYYLKPHRPKTYTPFSYYDLKFHCLRIDEVFTPAACGMAGDSNGDWTKKDVVNFLISCSLAKYDSTARTLFNAMIGRWHAIGIRPTYRLTVTEADEVFQYLDSDQLQMILKEWHYNQGADSIDSRPASFVDAYVGYENADLAGEWEEFERAVADEFLGQHYVMNPSPQNEFDLTEFETCGATINYKQSLSMTPSAEKLFSKSDLPWVNIASRSPASKAGAQSLVSGWFNYKFVRRLYYVNVPAAWGTIQDQVDLALHGNSDDDGSGFKDLEKGLAFVDNLMIDSDLWNKMHDANEAFLEDRGDNAPNRMSGPLKVARAAAEASSLLGPVNTAQVYNENDPDSFYFLDPFSGKGVTTKEHEHPKLLIFAPNYIARPSGNRYNGLGFSAWTGEDPVSGEIEKGMAINTVQSVGQPEPVADTECNIRCESGLLETLCRCPTDMEIASQFFVGLPFNPEDGGLLCPSFSLRGPHGTVKVILPYNSMAAAFDSKSPYKHFWGYAKKSIELKILLEGSKLVLGDDQMANNQGRNSSLSGLPRNSMSIRVNANDITNDANLSFGSNLEADAPAQMINVVVPSDLGGKEQMVTLDDYHNSIKNHFNRENVDVSQPSQSLGFSILGTEYDIKYKSNSLKDFLTPEKGLTEFNVSFGADGLTTSFTFENRPRVFPKLEATMNKIGPTLWKSWYK